MSRAFGAVGDTLAHHFVAGLTTGLEQRQRRSLHAVMQEMTDSFQARPARSTEASPRLHADHPGGDRAGGEPELHRTVADCAGRAGVGEWVAGRMYSRRDCYPPDGKPEHEPRD